MSASNRTSLFRTTAVLLLAAMLTACGGSGPKTLQQSRQLNGTKFELKLSGPDTKQLEQAASAALREMTRIADLLSHRNPDSPVSAINQAAGRQPVAIPAELMEVLARAQALAARSGGAFDVTLGSVQGWSFDRRNLRKPEDAAIAEQRKLVNYRDLRLDPRAGTAYLARPGMRIDLGALARMEMMQAGLRVLRESNIEVALIVADGDVAAFGGPADEPWQVGVPDPRAPHELFGVLTLDQGYVFSASDSRHFFMKDDRRYHSVLDPRTGYPTEAVRGVTLMGKDPAILNGLPQAIMAMGLPAGRKLVEQTPGVEGLIVDKDGTLWTSDGLKARLRLGRPLPGDR